MMKNLTQETPQKKVYPQLPEAEYKARLVQFDIKPNKAGTGTNGSAQFEILNGDFEKRRVFHCFILEHPNEKAVGFSNNRMNKLLSATGSESTIEDLGFDYTQVMDVAGQVPIILSVVPDEYENASGEVVQTNRISHFKRR